MAKNSSLSALHNQKLAKYRQNLIAYFLQLYPEANLEELEEVAQAFTLGTFEKKQIILSSGEHSNTVYFICEGLVRIYYVKEEKEITTWFIKENMIFASAYSILTKDVNYSNYEALEKCTYLKIEYNVFEEFYHKYFSIAHLGRRIIEAYYGSFMKRTQDVLFLSAEERYSTFTEHNSDLINRVPLRYVASYLGITQETLSRLRAKTNK
ncbi:MAG: Crp/Fnr family transcriptional regulator [Chitinophagales bacterium]